jgi:hypothetical protein
MQKTMRQPVQFALNVPKPVLPMPFVINARKDATAFAVLNAGRHLKI